MQSVNLFELASQQSKWVAASQKAIASNIANVNSSGFTPVDVAPFKELLARSSSAMAVTHPGHIGSGADQGVFQAVERQQDTTSGQDPAISIPEELIKASEVRRAYELNTAIVKSFHRMLMMTTRS